MVIIDYTAMTPQQRAGKISSIRDNCSDTSGGCWFWQGYCDKDGYPKKGMPLLGGGASYPVPIHHLIYSLAYNTILGAGPKASYHISHLCHHKYIHLLIIL